MVRQAVLRADPVERGWWHFTRPRGGVTAERLADVLPALAELEAAVAAGLTAVGYLAYEAAPAFDAALAVHPHGPLPLLAFGFFNPPQVLDEPPGRGVCSLGDWAPSLDAAAYGRCIERIKDWIARGETYQVNHTLRLRAPFAGDPLALARRLWAAQPTSFSAWLDLRGHAVCSASPELFFSLDGQQLASRPMKGTRPRGVTLEEDQRLAVELSAAEKDRAENLMIVDMVRNDLSRVAVTGSVYVPALFDVERYDTVWQMTSTVACRTRASLTEIVSALFPCASITGAPKVRTMEIIRELEPTPRGVYTGAIGWVGPGRRAQFSVAIRTVHVDRERGTAEYGVGGGIVWDSTAEGEYDEWRTKAQVLTAERPEFELLETLLWEPGHGWLLRDRHLHRMSRSAQCFGFPFDREAAVDALASAQGSTTPQRVRLLLHRDGTCAAQATGLAVGPARPWRLALAPEPVDPSDRLLYHKTTHRRRYEAAKAARPDADDVVLWNERGEATEATIANVVVLLDGELVTPPVSSGLLPGVYRELALERGWVRERVVRADDLPRAEAIWLINSVRRWVEAEWIG